MNSNLQHLEINSQKGVLRKQFYIGEYLLRIFTNCKKFEITIPEGVVNSEF